MQSMRGVNESKRAQQGMLYVKPYFLFGGNLKEPMWDLEILC
jgi:hypothetical protein